MNTAALIVIALGFMGCSTTKCRSIDKDGVVRDKSNPMPTEVATEAAPSPQTNLPPTSTNSGASLVPDAAPPQPPTEVAATGSIRVYKYDNSRQCGQGKTIALEEMAKQLKNIKVLSQEKKNDGMMRIQMCGAPSGVANVYEIDQKDMKKAIKLGFREWKYTQQ